MKHSGQSNDERNARTALSDTLLTSPIPRPELLDNLPIHMFPKDVAHILALSEIYRMVCETPGCVMEFGTRWGRNISLFQSLRELYEPGNAFRAIVGFDSFAGFVEVSEEDGRIDSDQPAIGDFSVSYGYAQSLQRMLDERARTFALGHLRRDSVVAGDVRSTLPVYLEDHPQTVIGLAYIDVDTYESTIGILEAITPFLTKGSVVAFDEIAHPKWPGETIALREAWGTSSLRLRKTSIAATPAFVVWGE